MPSNILLGTLKTNTNLNINKTILNKTTTNLAYQCFHGYKTHDEDLWDEIDQTLTIHVANLFEQNKQTASETLLSFA
ncbi:hypothetical protein [Spiroplasma sp. AdecLV25b]|uniref:hypothetical protein n=1 Tax=Spiroplasma sp. AdecLV25b TaxID=3027162 RepID=UPI0027DF0C72|nr:hypothetical protein [Spiroplasma sp. AdecLV25b]